MKLRGAYYPTLLKMASFEVQVAMNCDPAVLKFFSDKFIVSGFHSDLAIVIYEGEESAWKDTEKTWRDALKRDRERSLHLH